MRVTALLLACLLPIAHEVNCCTYPTVVCCLLSERVIINFHDKNVVIARFRDKNVVIARFRDKNVVIARFRDKNVVIASFRDKTAYVWGLRYQ